MPLIIGAGLVGLMLSCLIPTLQDLIKTEQMAQEQSKEIIAPPPKPFSVAEYMDKMEKLHLKALQERENEEPHIIVLWWGFDGLRLNADGTREWISRRPKTVPRSTLAEYSKRMPLAFAPLMNEINKSMLNDTCWTRQANCSTEAQIAALQSQLQAVNMQQWQNEQIQSMINQIQPARDINGRLRRYG